MVVVSKQLLYASPIWAKALVFSRNAETIIRPHRTIAIRATIAYRTISTAAVLVIAGMIPLKLLAWELEERYNCRKERETECVAREIS